jgi:hypothetical protein
MITYRQFVNETFVLRLGGGTHKGAAQKFMDDLHASSKPHPMNDRLRVIGKTAVHVSPGPDGIHLHDIQSHDRGKGDGGKALKHLTKLSDKHKVPISGVADAYENRRHTERLKNWYVRHGFEDHGGSKIDGYKIKYHPK